MSKMKKVKDNISNTILLILYYKNMFLNEDKDIKCTQYNYSFTNRLRYKFGS